MPPELRASCGDPAEGAPIDGATPRAVALWLVDLMGRYRDCAGRLDRIIGLVEFDN